MTKSYPSYKPSGIPLVGQIPGDWELLRGDGIFSLNRNSITKEQLNGKEFYHYSIPSVQEFNDALLETGTDVESNKQIVEGDEILYSKLNPRKETIIVSKKRSQLQICSTEFVVLKPKPQKCLTRFGYYLLSSYSTKDRVCATVQSATKSHQRANPDDIYKIHYTLPPLREQIVISTYLDKKTIQIDEAIQKKQRLIEMLQEERTALINCAVTRGIDESAPLKPSGASWLGEIPRHWKFLKLKFLTSLLKDGTHLPPPRTEHGYPLLSVRNLDDKGYIRFLEDDSKVSKEDFQLLIKSFQIQENDLLLAIVGATMGKVSLVPPMEPFAIQRSLAIIRVNSAVVTHKFLFYSLQSWYFQSLLWNTTGFSAQPGIYLGSLANFSIPIPSLEEQQIIVDEVEKKLSKTEHTISLINRELFLLQEFRTALINEVVTGKVCVL